MQTRIEPEKRTERYHFDSLHELATWVQSTPRTWQGRSSEKEGRGYKWDLDAGYEGAVRMAKYGWNEGADKVQDALKVFAPATPKPDTKTDFYGFRPHVPRYCAGAPDSMIRHTRDAESGSGRVVTLIVPVNAMCMTNAQHMANFGVGVVQYVNQMETQGMRVEVIACCANLINGWRSTFSWTVKRADQPLDLAVIAFAIGHPAMFRRIGFTLLERCKAPECCGYGQSADARLSDFINPAPGTIILNGMKDAHTNAKTPEAAFEYVSKQIEKAMEQQYAD